MLIYEDVGEAVDWLSDAFGFKERLRAGNDHAQLSVGEGAVFLGRKRVGQGFDSPDNAEFRPPRPNEVSHYVHVKVEDVDQHCEHAGQHAHGYCNNRLTTRSERGSTRPKTLRVIDGRFPSQ